MLTVPSIAEEATIRVVMLQHPCYIRGVLPDPCSALGGAIKELIVATPLKHGGIAEW